eukprot:SAG22_NODE_15_length_32914_cov_20.713546_9_plen_132_part_00
MLCVFANKQVNLRVAGRRLTPPPTPPAQPAARSVLERRERDPGTVLRRPAPAPSSTAGGGGGGGGGGSLAVVALCVLCAQDLKDAMSSAEISAALSLHSIKSHSWHIQGCCAPAGTGITEGLDWVVANIQQ